MQITVLEIEPGEIIMSFKYAKIITEMQHPSQEPVLFSSSIRDNIAYGVGSAEPSSVPVDDVIAAAEEANAHGFIMDFPEGYVESNGF